MGNAGWAQVWHLVLAIVARQPPFVEIMIATGAVFVAVMALEGIRSSVAAMWRAAPPPQISKTSLAMAASPPQSKSFSAGLVSLAAARTAPKRKPLTVSARPFRSLRPTIRRHPMLEFAAAAETPLSSANAPMRRPEGV